MAIFKAIQGKHFHETDDDIINLRFKCCKRKGETVNGDLSILLSKLNVREDSSLWDVKVAIWQSLSLDVAPVMVKKHRQTISESTFNNAADIPILRYQEGEMLLSKLGLPKNATKPELEQAILKAVITVEDIDSTIFPKGNKKPHVTIVTSEQHQRDQDIVDWTLKNAKGVCECCEKDAPFIKDDEQPFLEIHHVRMLSKGGSDTITNTVAVCPNCHRCLHFGKDKDTLIKSLYKRIDRLVQE